MRDDDGRDPGVPTVTTELPTRHLCLGCRLIQVATGQCVHCGGTTVAPIDLVRELLSYRDLSLAAERDLGMITALIAGGTFVFPILWPLALASLGALIVRVPVRHFRDRARLANPVAGILVAPPHPPAHAVVVRGTVRRFRGEVRRSAWDDAIVLAEEILIAANEGGVMVRHARAAPFLIETDDDERILVRGPVRLAAVAAWTEGDRKVRPGDAWLAALGLPPDLRVRGVAHRIRLVDGMTATIAVSPNGIGDEAIAEHAGLRDGGGTRVWRGLASEPVLVGAVFGPGEPRGAALGVGSRDVARRDPRR